MNTRIEAGTDIATLGIWDTELQRRSDIGRPLAALVREATHANLFLIYTGGDARHQAIVARVNSLWKTAEKTATPTLILALRIVDDASGLVGGSVRLDMEH